MVYPKYVAAVLDKIIGLSIENGIPAVDGVCRIGKFMVEVSPDKKAFSFWEDGGKGEKTTVISGNARILSVSISGRIMTLDITDQNFPSIEEVVRVDGDYPNFGFTWIWDQTRNMEEGILSYVRVEINENIHLAYQRKSGGEGYLIINPMGVCLLGCNLPKGSDKEKKILGVSFSQKIKFDAKMRKIVRVSNLKEFLDELRLSAKTKIADVGGI